MKSVVQSSNGLNATEGNCYATADDFQRLFGAQMAELFRLSLLLMGDVGYAERCLMLAMRKCFKSHTVPKERIFICARRMLVCTAIRLILGETASPAEIPYKLPQDSSPQDYSRQALPETLAILSLSDFERLAFVICVLEGYDIQDCAQLMGRAENDVCTALVQVTSRIGSFEERKNMDTSRTTQASTYSVFSYLGGEEDDACGIILD